MTDTHENSSSPNRITEIADRITQTVAIVGFFALTILTFLTFYDGGARALNTPRLTGFTDYGEIIYPIVIASCFPAGLLRQRNITVDIFASSMRRRVKFVMEAMAAMLTLSFFILIAWQFIEMTAYYQADGRTTGTIEIPLAPWWWITTTLMCFSVLIQAYVAFSWSMAVFTNKTPALAKLNNSNPPDHGHKSHSSA